jgi:hypothetical protein
VATRQVVGIKRQFHELSAKERADVVTLLAQLVIGYLRPHLPTRLPESETGLLGESVADISQPALKSGGTGKRSSWKADELPRAPGRTSPRISQGSRGTIDEGAG